MHLEQKKPCPNSKKLIGKIQINNYYGTSYGDGGPIHSLWDHPCGVKNLSPLAPTASISP
jgi:hypothetical protein